ncbi:MAG: citrate transporter [Lachnospiraceae bacterium]|nr:citrate transporter [Lachnospiraceae bacterium]
MLRKIILIMKNEVVLVVAAILAIASSFLIHPDKEYLGYVDFRTLGLLFCLMAVMGGFQRLGLFRQIAEGLLRRVGRSSVRVVLVLVLLAFFFSMLITNDVGLITFVPFTFTVLELLGEDEKRRLVIPVVVLETLGANLGSMLTPIGNPQNLYLYGKAGISVGAFLLLMLPYTMIAGLLLVICCVILGMGGKGKTAEKEKEAGESLNPLAEKTEAPYQKDDKKKLLLVLYGILFLLSLLTVADILPYYVTLAVTLVTILLFDRKTMGKVDYFLLLTFIAFFVFIGNMGRIPAFSNFLASIVVGREVPVAVLSSQAISNVPAALLLSGFSQNYKSLIIGVNLGGMGTLIASMASLISYKFVARAIPDKKGKYFACFTILNLVFLAILMAGYYALHAMGIS